MHGTSNNVTISGVASGTYNGIAHSDINGTYTSISNVTLDSYDITSQVLQMQMQQVILVAQV